MFKNVLKRFQFLLTGFLVLLFTDGNIIAQVIKNPLFNGFYAADPSVVQYHGKFYVYATVDPWGGDELAVFETADFITWQQKHINWPTKQQCTSATSKDSKVWAPSVVQKNGKFYMY